MEGTDFGQALHSHSTDHFLVEVLRERPGNYYFAGISFTLCPSLNLIVATIFLCWP
jgi:hypothetical protein